MCGSLQHEPRADGETLKGLQGPSTFETTVYMILAVGDADRTGLVMACFVLRKRAPRGAKKGVLGSLRN